MRTFEFEFEFERTRFLLFERGKHLQILYGVIVQNLSTMDYKRKQWTVAMERAVRDRFTQDVNRSIEVTRHTPRDVDSFIDDEMKPGGVFEDYSIDLIDSLKQSIGRRIRQFQKGKLEAVGRVGRDAKVET
jgi:hypothetical protein